MSHVNKIDIRNTYFQLYFLVEIEEPLQAIELANRNFKDDQLELARLLLGKGYHQEILELKGITSF